jgi:hypothetical protein
MVEHEKTTVAVPLTRIRDGRTLRTMVEGSFAFAAEDLGDLRRAASEAFADIVDYLRDYNDVSDMYSMRERMDVDRYLDGRLQKISEHEASAGAGLRHARVRLAADQEPMDWTIVYLVSAPHDLLPSMVRAPKTLKLT